ncbi:MAG TPA: 3-oxoacyl-[acyl-carrier-protein] synthase III C-terminal domain-containing protein [Myxococcaceae bacterium]|nr:3-oxoacyl-[acyl-carrier-protein] synthase III C-terminal domain-containing protein [Myxococcaceae bacterium]
MKSVRAVGIRSLAVSFPENVRLNAYFRERYPEVVAQAEEQAIGKLWKKHGDDGKAGKPDPFNAAMEPYLNDLFRGTVERRVLGKDGDIYTHLLAASKEALEIAGVEGKDVGVLLSTSLLPRAHGIGDGADLAGDLGMRGPGWNFESACSGSHTGLQMATALVSSGMYESALVVVGCSYSQKSSERDNMGWTCGDGAAAYLVTPQPEGYGVLGEHSVHTAPTCGHVGFEPAFEDEKGWFLKLTSTREAGRLLKSSSMEALPLCVNQALDKANTKLEEIDFFVFNTPLAWYTEFCASVLGIPLEKTINTYERYANTGPVLMPTNLFHAAKDGRIKKGDKVLLYTIGSASSAGASVIRWGDVALGEAPVWEKLGAPAKAA